MKRSALKNKTQHKLTLRLCSSGPTLLSAFFSLTWYAFSDFEGVPCLKNLRDDYSLMSMIHFAILLISALFIRNVASETHLVHRHSTHNVVHVWYFSGRDYIYGVATEILLIEKYSSKIQCKSATICIPSSPYRLGRAPILKAKFSGSKNCFY